MKPATLNIQFLPYLTPTACTNGMNSIMIPSAAQRNGTSMSKKNHRNANGKWLLMLVILALMLFTNLAKGTAQEPSSVTTDNVVLQSPCEIVVSYDYYARSSGTYFQRPGDSLSSMNQIFDNHYPRGTFVVPGNSAMEEISIETSASYGLVTNEGQLSSRFNGSSSDDFALVAGQTDIEVNFSGKLLNGGLFRREHSDFSLGINPLYVDVVANTDVEVLINDNGSVSTSYMPAGSSWRVSLTNYSGGYSLQEFAGPNNAQPWTPSFDHHIETTKDFVISCTPVTGTLRVRECILGLYFVAAVPVSNRYDAKVDWSSTEDVSGEVSFDLAGQTAVYPITDDPVSQSYNMGTALSYSLLGSDSPLTVRAFTNSGTELDNSPQIKPLVGLIAPIWLQGFDVQQIGSCAGPGSVSQVTYLFKSSFPEEPLEGQVTPPDWLPYLGGEPLGLQPTQANLNLEFQPAGDGSAKLDGMSGFAVAGQALDVSIAGTGDFIATEGEGLHINSASLELDGTGVINSEEPLVDLVCKATTAGTCPLRALESKPVIGKAVAAFNEAAVVKATVEGGINTTAHFASNGNDLDWNQGTITPHIKERIALVSSLFDDAITGEVYGGGSGSATYQVPANPSYLQRITLELFAGAKFKAWLFACHASASYGWIYPTNTTGTGTTTSDCELEVPFTTPVFRANEWQSSSDGWHHLLADPAAAPETEMVIASDVFPEARPALVTDNNTSTLLWVHNEPTLPIMQSTEIVFSQFDDSTWITPTAITTDTLQDFAPQAAVDDNGNIVAVWQRNKTEQDASTTLDATYTKDFEIASSIWDGNGWSAPVLLTNNNALDSRITLATGNDGQLLLVWTSNNAGELMGSSTEPDDLYYALWNGTQWSPPQIVQSGLDSLLGLTAARYDNMTMRIVYSRDDDGDFSTIDDQELFEVAWNGASWDAPTPLTSNSVSDRNPSLHYAPNGMAQLLWLQDDTLMLTTSDFSNTPRPIAIDSHAGIMDYKSLQDSEGNLTLLWQGISETGTDIFYATYEAENDTVNGVNQLTNDESLEKFLTPAHNSNDDLLLAYNKTHLITETITISPTLIVSGVVAPGQTDLNFLNYTFTSDLHLDGLAVIPEPLLISDTAQISVTLSNIGDQAVVSPTIATNVLPPTGTASLIHLVLDPDPLPSRTTRTYSVAWQAPPITGTYYFYAVADPDNVIAEENESNNAAGSSLTVFKPFRQFLPVLFKQAIIR